jgi:hypothetical protein
MKDLLLDVEALRDDCSRASDPERRLQTMSDAQGVLSDPVAVAAPVVAAVRRHRFLTPTRLAAAFTIAGLGVLTG